MAEPPAKDAFPRWPLWLPIAAIVGGVIFGFVAIGVLIAVLDGTGIQTNADAPAIKDIGTLIIDASVVGMSLVLAATVARPRAWHFGLRGGRLGYSAGVAALGMLAIFLFGAVYANLVHTKNKQTVVQDLGVEMNTALLVGGAVLLIAVAPVCEELFFRGFLFRVLRLRLPLWIAAVADGLLFGLVHYQKGVLLILPVLAFLGLVFCYVYERTGTLYATIAMHALNNTISLGASTEDGWVVALSVGAVVIAGCAIGIARGSRGTSAAAPNPSIASAA